MISQDFPGGSLVKNLPASVKNPDWLPGLGGSPGGEIATHSSILAWTISWTGEPVGLQSMELQRIGHD